MNSTVTADNSAQAHGGRKGTLNSPSFLALLATQFLGAMNDNMFRWFIIPIGKPVIGDAEALSLGLACFTLPYLLLASVAGYLADRFSKRTVIIACKVAEILIMVLGIWAIQIGNIYLLFSIVALMGCQSALFGPAKFGSIPEMLRDNRLSRGNGLMGLITVISSALGFIAGNYLFHITQPSLSNPGTFSDLKIAAFALVGVAVLGTLVSLKIRKLPVAAPDREFPFNPAKETWHQMQLLRSSTPLLRTALGVAFFWMLASLAQMNVDTYGINELQLSQKDIGPLLGILVFGVALGSILAGVWSSGRIELGIVPLGAAGIVFTSMMLFLTGNSVGPGAENATNLHYSLSLFWLFLLGVSSGLFDIPLETFLQHRSDVETRGSILAAANFLAFAFILVASFAFWVMQKHLELSASQIFMVLGLLTVPVGIYIFKLLPNATIRFMVWLVSCTIYKLRVKGLKNLPKKGGALLVANHVSWLDGIFLILTSTRPVRMIAYSTYVEAPWVAWLSRLYNTIPINVEDGPKALMKSIKTARTAIENGELVCIFAEGKLTRSGYLQPFQSGLMKIIKGTGAPVIPVYIDELWGSIFSFHGGNFFWKKPRRWPYPVSIRFGKPIPHPENEKHVQRVVQNLGVDAANFRKTYQMIPPRLFLRKCKSQRFQLKVADSMGDERSGGMLLTGALVLRRLLNKFVLKPDEKMVGVLLPPSVGGCAVNASLAISGRVPINLNYTLSDSDINYCIQEAGIKTVLTSQKFLEKRPIEMDANVLLLDDLKSKVTLWDKLFCMFQAFLVPAWIIERSIGLHRVKSDELSTVIFTSGSTGRPKGVMLSHHNIISNINSADDLLQLSPKDCILGILPFFHSFGYTISLWMPFVRKMRSCYHFNPTDARTVGKLIEKYQVTLFATTPTFLRHYLKRCTKEQFASMDVVITGAEKLPQSLAREFEEKFGIFPTEGYGTTELSPVAAVNVPPSRQLDPDEISAKPGTVGRPVPCVMAKTVDPETMQDLPEGEEGLLFIKGPNVMKGYLNNPEKTAEVIIDGWYNTGDFARIDEDGFITITGRQTRFSKIGGEMVPHLRIEEIITGIVSDPEADESEVEVAVTAVPDPRKGERLIVLHKPLHKSVDEILKELSQEDLPNLWLPSSDSFLEVDSIPLLGTGKLDLAKIKQIASEAFPVEVTS
ncbi:acyl-[ACP]--phospholipid O-acyltransferase [Gimesia panareensis]|uniref:acyl-[ACP]--phospholipid O-acyltransferase n=1 Tax=Gimesia panareensis TaxID=2527978 RepID=UPI001189649F|nr:acyl-[ACP]--phospholipid O-acyltransferase [Gimesia panareensis]QDU49057.1 Bifunctional protein Aas [Gimesia panareensis]